MMNSQLRKAAILIASLDRASAESLLTQMPKEFAKRVLAAAKQLGKIDPEEQQSVMRDFLARKEGKSAIEKKSALPEVELALSHDAAEEIEKPAPPTPQDDLVSAPQRFSFVANDSVAPLAAILQREQPRLAALILAHLPADRGAAVLSHLDHANRLAIVERIADIEDAAPLVLDELEQELKGRLLRERLKLEGSRQGLAALSGILQASDPELRSQISDAMGAKRKERLAVVNKSAMPSHPSSRSQDTGSEETEEYPSVKPANETGTDLAEPIIAAPLIAFSGLSALDDVSLAAVFGAVSPQVALLALVGAEEALVRRILNVLPRKEAAGFRKRLEEVGPLRLKEVEQAQTRLSLAAGELLKQRRITLPIHDRARMAA